jgi:hypothetical protein
MDRLPEIHQKGMAIEEVGEKVLAGIRRNSMYIFSHPEFREELEELFAIVVNSLPIEDAPKERVEFEQWRRNGVKKAIEEADKMQ